MGSEIFLSQDQHWEKKNTKKMQVVTSSIFDWCDFVREASDEGHAHCTAKAVNRHP